MRDFYSLSQGKRTSNQEYYDELNSMVLSAEKSGARIGKRPKALSEVIKEIVASPDHPTTVERAVASKFVNDRYLAVAFLLGADRMRFGTMIEEIENEYLGNRDVNSNFSTYKRTVAEAYNYLCNHKKDPRNLIRFLNNSAGEPNTGVAFAQHGRR